MYTSLPENCNIMQLFLSQNATHWFISTVSLNQARVGKPLQMEVCMNNLADPLFYEFQVLLICSKYQGSSIYSIKRLILKSDVYSVKFYFNLFGKF